MKDTLYKPTAEKIHEFMKKIAVPRMVTTQGEKDTQVLLFKKMKDLSYKPSSETFEYNFSLSLIMKLGFILGFLILILSETLIIFELYYIPAAIILILIVILLPIAIKLINFDIELSWGPKLSSKNIIGSRLGEKNQEFEAKIALVLLTAHYDSIGKKYPQKVFKKIFIITAIFGPIILLLYVFLGIWAYFDTSSLFFAIMKYVLLISSNISLVLIILILLNKKANNSNGACDNASGCAILTAIAERLNETRTLFNWLDLRFVFMGAEEIGLFGSRKYLTEHLDELKTYKDVYIINVDMVGSEIAYIENTGLIRKKPINRVLNDLIKHHSNQLKIKTRPIPSIGFSGSDHMPFLKQKFEACCFISSQDKQIHGPLDTVEKVLPQKLGDATELIFNMIQSLEKRIDDKINLGE
jgi:peptidase M28-like protein